MAGEDTDFLKEKLGAEGYGKLAKIENASLHSFIAKYVRLCRPAKVTVCSDSAEDISYTRESAIRNGEEAKLSVEGHTVHFDGYDDQARDKENTKFLVPKGVDLGPEINETEREAGLDEIRGILDGIMEGKELFIKFYSLGPSGSVFTIPCLQLTDSAYVAHSEDLLYRQGYSEFVRQGGKARPFKFVHSQGALGEAGLGLMVSKDIDKRRIYIDLGDEVIFSANTQYGGNTLGLKKLAMRLAINRASKEDWLTEHMLVMGINGPGGRVSYFTGAFPSMCGKTSTSMVQGERIVGDDIAYLRKIGGEVRAVNVEKGMFGVIQGVNSGNNPLIWKALTEPGEIIFSNILVTEGSGFYWNGKGGEVPENGVNHSGEWSQGKSDANGNEIPASHKNARFTLDIKLLSNRDPRIEDPEGVPVGGIVYGGRDSDTSVPVEESFGWEHGIITKGASLESETTAATLGKEGVRKFNPMSNLDFLSIPISTYVEDNLGFAKGLSKAPKIFSVNYFLKDGEGKFVNGIEDKRVWLKWMELRAAGDVDAIRTPTGFIPKYEDLKNLFTEVLGKEYSKDDYGKQFMVRVPENLAKIDRVVSIYKERVPNAPGAVFRVLEEQRKRLEEARKAHGDYYQAK